jgi:hypothetical protein
VTAPASSYTDEGRGPLSGIEPNASKEIGKLWTNWESRSSTTAGYGYMTRDQVNTAIAVVSKRIDQLVIPSASGVQVAGGGGGGGGGGIDPRPLNNTWTGTNVWTGGEPAGINRNRFLGLTSGPITAFVSDTIMLEQAVNGVAQYQALVDIQKTSDASIFGGTIGGNAAIYLQHRSGGNATQSYGAYGIRSQVQSYAVAPYGVPNAVASGYFAVLNQTVNGIGWGLKVEASHKGAGQTATYGVEATVLRYFLDGKTIAFHARAAANGPYNQDNDYAFLASGVGSRFRTAFSAGSGYLGGLNCDVGLDLSYATCNVAAITIPPAKTIYLNGPENTAGLVFNPGGAFQFTVNGDPKFSFGTDGTLVLHYAQFVALAGASIGFLRIAAGGFLIRIPAFADA